MGTIAGLDNFKQFMCGIHSAFPDIEWFGDDTVAEGDKITYHYHWADTHQGELTGIPATGKQVTVYGMEMNRVENGQMIETWNYSDVMGLMQQLDAIPGPGKG